MKKLFALVLALMMAAMLSVTAFAEIDFVPSVTDAPVVSDVTFGENPEECIAVLRVTPMKDTAGLISVGEEMDQPTLQAMDVAWQDVLAHKDNVAALCAELPAELARENLTVTRLFDVSCYCNKGHDLTSVHHYVSMELTAEECSHLVALLHYTDYDENGQGGHWENVPYERLADDTIQFSITHLSPFALVVKSDDNGGRVSPQTGEAQPVMLALGAVCFAGAAVLLLKRGKKSA